MSAVGDRSWSAAARALQVAADGSLRVIRRVLFPRGRVPRQPRLVLVHLVGNVGDIVVATPMLQSLAGRFPDAPIVLLTSGGREGNPGAGALLHGADAIDEILEYDVDTMKRWGAARQMVGRLRARRPDLVVLCPASLTGWRQNARNLVFARLVGARFVTLPRVPTIRWGLAAQVRVRGWFPQESERYLGLLDELRPVPPRRPVDLGPLEPDAAALVDRCTPPGRIVAVCPGGKQLPHRWPVERFVEVVEALATDPELSFVAVGNAAERDLCERVLHPVSGRSHNAAGVLALGASAELLSRCSLLITNDTGPMHLAAARDVAIVAVFGGAMPPGRWYPWAPQATVLRAEAACPTCLGRPDQPHCVERISSASVIRAARRTLDRTLDRDAPEWTDTVSCLVVDPVDGSVTMMIEPTDHGWRQVQWTSSAMTGPPGRSAMER